MMPVSALVSPGPVVVKSTVGAPARKARLGGRECGSRLVTEVIDVERARRQRIPERRHRATRDTERVASRRVATAFESSPRRPWWKRTFPETVRRSACLRVDHAEVTQAGRAGLRFESRPDGVCDEPRPARTSHDRDGRTGFAGEAPHVFRREASRGVLISVS